MADDMRVLVVGLGRMGLSHAKTYASIDGWSPVGLVARSGRAAQPLPADLAGLPMYNDFATALAESRPDAVSINTWTDTHVEYSIRAMEAGAHVFVEKPLAATVEAAQDVVDTAVRTAGNWSSATSCGTIPRGRN